MPSHVILPRHFRRLATRPALLLFVVASTLAAQQQPPPRALTAADYDRAVQFLAPSVNPLVVGGSVSANWLSGDRFWYRNALADGAEFIVIDPVKKTRARAFDQVKVAAALSAASGATYGELKLPFQSFEYSADGRHITFDAGARHWDCDSAGAKCSDEGPRRTPVGGSRDGRDSRGGGRGGAQGDSVLSPDGKRTVFIRHWNLWVRDVATGAERALTTDGVKDFGYATDNAGWAGSDRPMVLWSPDSKKIATSQQDERTVGDMYLVETRVGHPVLKAWKYPLPGDSVVAMLHRVIIDVDAGSVVRLQMPPDYHRATLGDNISMSDYNWSPDGSKLALVSTSRDHKQAVFRVADAITGAVRTVFEETVPTEFESRTGWRVLWPTNEVLWYSQRDDWGQLYLYDLTSGQLKGKVTSGEGPVTRIERVDQKTRTLWYEALGREAGQDPYFRHF